METPGCGDYRLALETKDKSFHEIKVLHAALSYGFDGLQDLGEALKGGPDALVGSEAVFRQLDRSLNTLSAVWDMLERRRGELEIMLKAKAPTATEEDRAAAEHIKVLGRGFAGGATIRHPTLAKELEAFMKEATSSRLKALAKAGVKKRDGKDQKKDTPKKENSRKDKEGGARGGGRPNE